MADAENTRKALQKEVETYRNLQAELQKLAKGKQELTARFTETETVVEELKLLDDEANVFKAVGPVLVKQDLVEARSNVSNRLEFIKKDIDRLDVQIKGVESKMLDREKEMMKLQRKLQGGAAAGP
ncbi:hypothetical protein CHLRE_12g502750v5 [Chlamydomonas reinhardtii]|uniref:Prefoldin subunit 6 n=1 Tax=Chlamydomonas reinhardtii TaxID=3055 RepID=A8IJG5_CHLRE|nr:uncharacterized protein CHLRE_12g502750v5 [Chlamydomonas reinhardtii]PNW74955.1 hypothetical protein CHLRE_12g502750v5 [Chlamydomonas reinhardtii]|eukprot:XP_001690977.1 predicted protein [Chlamydomonas reinhardtii]